MINYYIKYIQYLILIDKLEYLSNKMKYQNPILSGYIVI